MHGLLSSRTRSVPRLSRSLFALLLVVMATPLVAAVPLFGPERFDLAEKQKLTTTRTFAIDAACDTPLTVYELLVSPQRLKGGSIALNGATLVSDQQLRDGAPVTVQVKLAVSNTLAISLEGDEKSAATATIALQRRTDVTTPLGAEKTYTLAGDKAQRFDESFDVSDLTGTFSVVLVNGAAGSLPADDISVVLNGVEVVSKPDIESRGNDQLPQRIEKPVALAAHNTLAVTAKTNKAPASFTVRFIRHMNDGKAPVLKIPALRDGVIVAAAPFSLKGTAIDDASPVTVTVNGASVAVGSDGTFGRDITLAAGTNQIVVIATDCERNTARLEASVLYDAVPPQLAIAPPAAAITNASTVTLSGTVADALSGVGAVDCGGSPATLQGNAFTCTVKLTLGGNDIQVVAVDNAGNFATATTTVVRDSDAPVIAVATPEAGTTTTATSIAMSGAVADDDQVASLAVGGSAVTLGAGGQFHTTVALADGANSIAVVAKDRAGNTASLAIPVTRFTVPTVSIDSPEDLAVVRTATVTIRGTVDHPAANVIVNGMPAAVANGAFSAEVPLIQGRTVITATATTPAGQVGTTSINIYRDSIPPRVIVNSPADNATVYESPISIAGAVDDIVVGTINAGQVRVTVNGLPAEVANRGFLLRELALKPGLNTLSIAAVDQGGNTTVITQNITLAAVPLQARLVTVSGDGQRSVIGQQLAQPVVVRAVNSSGQPLPNRAVTFEVVENNGTVSDGTRSGRSIATTTNAQGEASVRWTLGTRAGAGNHRLQVSGDGLGAPLGFEAIAATGQPALIVADSGNNQFGIAGEELARPLIAVAVDAGSNRLANVPVVFSVRTGGGSFGGQQSITVMTDSDGRAIVRPTLGPQVGPDSNIYVAGVAGVVDGTAFVASSRAAGPAAETRISGVVLDNTDLPVAGVSVRIEGTSLVTQTNAQGQFLLAGAPVGYAKLIIDGSTAQRPGTWPMLEFQMYTLSGNDNNVGMPIYLLPIDVRRGITVDETHGGTLTLPELPGFSLTIAPGSATFPGGSRTGTVSVTLVKADHMPMTPGFGQQPRFIVTIQPPGVHFDPPAAISFPNVDGLKPGEVTEMYSFDHDLGQFVAIGTGSVSADGSVITSDPGIGIIKGGWHCGGNPATSGTTHRCEECQKCEGDSCVPDPGKNNSSCSDDGVPCTYDICRDGSCTHQTPRVTVTLESPGDNFKIQTEPRMPVVVAKAQISGVTPDPTPSAQFKWVTKIKYVAQNGREIKLDLEPVTAGKEYRPSFSAIRGGDLKIKATLLKDGAECASNEQTKKIGGLNPAFALISAELGGDTLAKMACHESARRLQFEANGTPVQHLEPKKKNETIARVGVGIMQVTDNPSDNAFWNWKTNLQEGLRIFRDKRADAVEWNQRQQRNHKGLRSLTEAELLIEQITLYNGGHYWKVDEAKNDWYADPRLQPYDYCKDSEKGDVVTLPSGRTATCTPYYDLVQAENGCQ